jgi:bifunctional DNA-binding transcriptional regulator/antitoxin component of YhaV-PrlF toxin-antitoxin module
MEPGVKKSSSRATHAPSRSRVSGKHQITIPSAAFNEAGLREGDVVRVSAQGSGRVVIERMDELLDQFVGALRTKGKLGQVVRKLRAEWD